jgi:hypothetical protein
MEIYCCTCGHKNADEAEHCERKEPLECKHRICWQCGPDLEDDVSVPPPVPPKAECTTQVRDMGIEKKGEESWDSDFGRIEGDEVEVGEVKGEEKGKEKVKKGCCVIL